MKKESKATGCLSSRDKSSSGFFLLNPQTIRCILHPLRQNHEYTDVPGTGGCGSVALLPSRLAWRILEAEKDVDLIRFHLLPPLPAESLGSFCTTLDASWDR
jgi:hypothetical protein